MGTLPDYHQDLANYLEPMLSIGRRIVVALLGLAMTSQIVQGQLRLCDEMNMGDASSQLMPAGEHGEHDPLPATHAISSVASLDHSMEPTDCTPSAGCVNPPAFPVIPDLAADVRNKARSEPAPPGSAGGPFVRPDLPPPRI